MHKYLLALSAIVMCSSTGAPASQVSGAASVTCNGGAHEVRVAGAKLMAKHRIKEGIRAIVRYARTQDDWASEHRTPELMKILLSYGTHARAVIPELTGIANYFEKDEKDFPKELMLRKARCVREAIVAIEASTDTPELTHLK